MLDAALPTSYAVLDRWEDSLETRETALELWRAVGRPASARATACASCRGRCWRLCRGAEAEAASAARRSSCSSRRAVHRSCPGAAPPRGAVLQRWRVRDRAPRSRGAPATSPRRSASSTWSATRSTPRRAACRRALARSGARLAAAMRWRWRRLGPAPSSAVARAYANLLRPCPPPTPAASWLAERAHVEGLDYCDEHDIATYANCLRRWRTVAARGDSAGSTRRSRSASSRMRGRGPVPGQPPRPAAQRSPRSSPGVGEPDRLRAPRHRAWRTRRRWARLSTSSASTWPGPRRTGWRATVDAAADACLRAAADRRPGRRCHRAERSAPGSARLGRDRVPGQVEAPYAAEVSGDVARAVRAWDERGLPLRRGPGPARRSRRGALARGGGPASTRSAPRPRREWHAARLRDAGARGDPGRCPSHDPGPPSPA